MEPKISNVMHSSSFFPDPNKITNSRKQKDFTSTLKSQEQNSKEKNDFQSKYEKLSKNESQKTSDYGEEVKKNEKKEENLENDIKNNGEKDTNKDYKDKYNLFFNVFNSIEKLENTETLIQEEDSGEIIKLVPLSEKNIELAEESFSKDEEILKNLLNLNETESKKILGDEKVLEKNLFTDLNLHGKKSSRKENDEIKTNKDSGIVNIKPSKENQTLISEYDEEENLEYDKNQLRGPEKSSKEETSGNSSKESKSEFFKIEETDEGSREKVEVKPNIENKSSFTFEKQEIKFTEMNNVEIRNQEPVDKKQFMEHIIEKVKYDLTSNKNQIRMTLKPESLGEMIMEVEVVKNSLVAKIIVDNQKSKELIENNLFQLKEGVKDTGLEIKTFEVFVGNNSDFDKHNSNGFNFNKRNEKLKVKVKDKENEIGFYEDSVQSSRVNPLDIYSESSLNLLA